MSAVAPQASTACTLAPRLAERYRTISKWPCCAASMSAVAPPARFASTLAPCSAESIRSSAWNDFKWALKWSKGWFHHSMMQLCHAFNVNYGPFPRGGNTAKKQDIHMEWRALKPKPCDRFRALLPQICMGRGVPEPGRRVGFAPAGDFGGRALFKARPYVQVGRMV